MPALLDIQKVTKHFPGTLALKDVDFDLTAGEVHALIGENGAGKSTLIKIIAGVYQPDSGTIHLNGSTVQFKNPADALEQGIKVVYQELDLAPSLSVAENVFLGSYPHTRFGTVDWRKLHEDTAQLLRDLGLRIDPRVNIDELRVAEQQLVEIARALSRQARIIIMDEPTSALSPSEIERLFVFIENLKQRQVGVIYVSHKLDEIYRIADRVTVLRDGDRITTQPVKETTSQQLVTWMVGREIKDLFPKTPAAIGSSVLEVRDVAADRIGPVSFDLRAGEVLAVFGLMGAGVHTLGRLLFGDKARSGTVTLDGAKIHPNSPSDAIHKGMGLLTESRKEDGLLLPLNVKENMTLASLAKFANYSLIQGRAEANAAMEYVEKLSIKTPSLRQKIRYLSGGNQQKALIGRWLLQNLKVLVLSEPTRGIDVGSKSEIYRLIDELAHHGMGILVLSTELPEVLGIADRILVIREGQFTGEFTRAEATQEKLMAAAATSLAAEAG
ncbi:MAG: sugar ABC transporter ATP-binding protein [Anaerolineae bacterium]|nr:sugar ABC transporter ATP-binding protein [Anaerolineae bacterium]